MFASAVMRSTEAADLMAWPLDERAPRRHWRAATPMYPVLAAATGIKFTRYYGYTVENGNAVVVRGRARKYTILIVLNLFLIG